MGATSVTGVSGPGTSQGSQKGSQFASLGVSRLIGPRVVLAGQVTLDGGGNATVNFPDIGGVAGDYVGFATNTNAAIANAVNVTGLTTTSITLVGTAGHVVNYMVVKVGLGIPVIQTN